MRKAIYSALAVLGLLLTAGSLAAGNVRTDLTPSYTYEGNNN
jgi:hypothetical protein